MDQSPECLPVPPRAAASRAASPWEAGSLPCESLALWGVIYLEVSTHLWLLFQELDPFTDGNNTHLWQGSPKPHTSPAPRNRVPVEAEQTGSSDEAIHMIKAQPVLFVHGHGGIPQKVDRAALVTLVPWTHWELTGRL
jgi:hypothetical protein